jgi:hypothetical protein
MKPPSLQAGEYGTWVATTDRAFTGYPVVPCPLLESFKIKYT